MRSPAIATPAATAADPSRFRAFREAVGRFWLEHVMMWSIEYCPWVARVTKPFFLAGAWMWSPRLRAMTLHNARVILGDNAGGRRAVQIGEGDDLALVRLHPLAVARESHVAAALLRQIESVEGVENFQAARRLGRGLIIATAHLGDFECGMAALHEIEPRVHVAFHRDPMHVFERLRTRQRQRLGVREAPIDAGPGAWLAVRDALLADEIVLLQVDRALPGQKGIVVPFLHSHAIFASGPARLSILTRAPILPAFAVRTAKGRVRVALEPPILPEEFSDDVLNIVTAIASVTGRWVAQFPQQYHGVHGDWMGSTRTKDRHAA